MSASLPPFTRRQRLRHQQAVLFKQGCGCEFLISLLLALLGYLPGVIYAWWIIYTNREDPGTHRRVRDGRHHHPNSRRSYVSVASTPPPSGNTVQHYGSGEQPQGPQSYTTTTTTQDGPIRTTRTVTRTTHQVQVPVDKKDQNVTNPPPY
ncbi:hypothetical protein BGZ83_002184 [Gryganskiella cystojenkinii]|nr:hypothetical protein BGZ83_002184 [Gryganskiella cystojenkinii]